MQFTCPHETALLMNVNTAFNRSYGVALYSGLLTWHTSKQTIWNAFLGKHRFKKREESFHSSIHSLSVNIKKALWEAIHLSLVCSHSVGQWRIVHWTWLARAPINLSFCPHCTPLVYHHPPTPIPKSDNGRTGVLDTYAGVNPVISLDPVRISSMPTSRVLT